MSPAAIVPATADHVDAITRQCMATVLDTIPELAGDPEIARRHVANFTFEAMRDMIAGRLDAPTHRTLVAEADGVVVGYAIAFRKPDPEGRLQGYLFSLGVRPEVRRQGVATALLDEVERWFAAGPAPDYLLAHTHVTNHATRALLGRRGFVEHERFEQPWPHLSLRR